jgi:hypothetical protein
MPFETFKRQRLTPTDEPLITIQKKGVFSLNRAAYEAIGEPAAVELLYDREARKIGLRKVKPSVAHAYRVRAFGKSGMSWLVSGTAFTNYYDIAVKEPVRRTAQLLNQDTLVIDLNDPGVVVTPNRTRKR